jgi:hypothetical protein
VQAFASARADIDAGNCKAAIPKLEFSLANEPSVGAHLSMADCYEELDLLAAWRELKEAANLAAERHDDRLQVARARAAALEPRLATIRLAAPQSTLERAGLEVRIDGILVRPFLYRDGAVATTPGTHEVEVLAPKKKPWRQRVALAATGAVELRVTLEDEPAPPEPAAAPAPASPEPPAAAPLSAPGAPAPGLAPATVPPHDAIAPSSPAMTGNAGGTQRLIGAVAAGLGLAGVGLGAVSGVVALGRNSDLRRACGGSVQQCRPTPDMSSVTQAQDSARSAAAVSTAGFVAGGALVVTGVVLYLVAPSLSAPSPSPRDARLGLAPYASPGGAGVVWTARFF